MKNNPLKNFHTVVIARILILTITIAVACYFYTLAANIQPLIIGAVLVLLQIYSLFHYINFINKELSRFLMAIKYSDFSQTFNRNELGGTFKSLGESFEQVITKFHETKREKEEHYKYLQTVTHHVGMGLISFNQQGKIELINNSAKKILKVKNLNNINDLGENKKELKEAMLSIRWNGKRLIKINDENEITQLSMHATEFKLRDQIYRLVAFQNIQNELEEREMDAWQKLIRVLTHEIMNSVTPISSLAATVSKILADAEMEGVSLDKETVSDLVSAANTIHKRSLGLINFIDKYRNLTRIPKPDFKIIPIEKLFERIRHLMVNEMYSRNIQFIIQISPPSLEMTADSELIEQVLINLIMNSIYAVSEKQLGRIELTARLDEYGRVLVQVKDNGAGISKDIQDKIFIPFFSTKKEGSGIGLSLSRQIMRIHGGTISVTSAPDIQTTFTLRF